VNLGQYLQKTRFMLRDALSTAFQQQDLIDLINQARADLIVDTFCCRALTTIATVANQDKYTFQTVLQGLLNQGLAAVNVLQINTISVFWSSNLVPTLDYMPFDELQAIYRSFRGFTFIPFIWGMFDNQSFFVEPIPNSVYNMEIDCVYLPTLLQNTTDLETVIPPGFADYTLIPWLAASYAKYNQNAYGESERFFQKYALEMERRMGVYPAYRVPSYYGADPRRP
jgi:hypothetical protein